MAVVICTCPANGQNDSLSWRDTIVFGDDSLSSNSLSGEGLKWIKFTVLLDPCSPDHLGPVYFQNSQTYLFHYDFAVAHLEPFFGMNLQQFNAVTLSQANQQAVLGSVIWPPLTGYPPEPLFPEYGIQFVRQEPYAREMLRDVFNHVKATIQASPDVTAFYFPTYEQQDQAKADQEWLATQEIPIGSVSRWARGNTCYSQGWAYGRLKYVDAGSIDTAYGQGLLEPNDILLTNAIPAEIPQVAGIMSLAPTTPNSHVAILAQTWNIPFVHLALADDARRAEGLVDHKIALSVTYDVFGACQIRMIDAGDSADPNIEEYLETLKQPRPLAIDKITPYGAYTLSTEGLTPDDIRYVGGKAANFGMLREVLPDNSPKAIALTFDLWTAFLDQPLSPTPRLELAPGHYIVLWADGRPEKGLTHLDFRLSRSGEFVGLYDADGITLDTVKFGAQSEDVSYGRFTDGNAEWQQLSSPSPGASNSPGQAPVSSGLVINELMADNETTIEDPDESRAYPDWIELYNGSDETVELNGLFLTDDPNDPTKWQIPSAISGSTLRQEIALRLAEASNDAGKNSPVLSRILAGIRRLFETSEVTAFDPAIEISLLQALTDANTEFDPYHKLRFRSSTNMEDSDNFTGAGLYDSYSGCLADSFDTDSTGPCRCDPNQTNERSIFRAIRRVFASFYNDNAYLERQRYNVNENDVGMAVLVHHSFPDEIELANGVATVNREGPAQNSYITFVTQQGAVSVTNPPDNSVPEEVSVRVYPSGSVGPPRLDRISNLVRLGETVMAWSDDYDALTDMVIQVSNHFSNTTGKIRYILDLEYKLVALGSVVLPDGGLVVKQLREVPRPNETPTITPVLLNEPTVYEIFTGEFEFQEKIDPFAYHRLKSQWHFATNDMLLTPADLNDSLFDAFILARFDTDSLQKVSEEITTLTGFTHSFDTDKVIEQWALCNTNNQCQYQLDITVPTEKISQAESPVKTLTDFGLHPLNLEQRCFRLDVQYQDPVKSWYQHLWSSDPPSGLTETTTDTVYLWPRQLSSDEDIHQVRLIRFEDMSIETSFYYPPAPDGFADWNLHTAPIKRFEQTTLTGFISHPIILNGYYSQTCKPEHHNLIEHFLFEPQLETDIIESIRQELIDQNIKLIHVIVNYLDDSREIIIYGFDDQTEALRE